MKRSFFKYRLFFLILFFSVPALSDYSGEWNRISLQFTVNIESWGTYCGTLPKSYYNKTVQTDEIMENNGHLFFSIGGLRTDKCNSPDPSLNRLNSSKTANTWSMTCETPKSSSKYEKIEYRLTGEGGNKLTYVAKSKFNWTLNNDRCVIDWTERRVYQRPASSQAKQTQSPIIKVHDSTPTKDEKKITSISTTKTDNTCKNTGPASKLIIFPQNSTISPSQSVCFQLRAVDSKGCRFPINAKWSVSQDGKPQPHLLTEKGCFEAGETAAESEGVYEIRVDAGGIHALTTIEVAYPDITDLARIRLDLTEELDQSLQQDVQKQVKEPISITPSIVTQTQKEEKSMALLIFALIATLCALVLILILFAVLKKQKNAITDEVDQFETQNVSRETFYDKNTCPECGKNFSGDAQFCPFDGTKLLAEESLSILKETAQGNMICPVCEKGYDLTARFCPHDSSKLITYEEWKQIR